MRCNNDPAKPEPLLPVRWTVGRRVGPRRYLTICQRQIGSEPRHPLHKKSLTLSRRAFSMKWKRGSNKPIQQTGGRLLTAYLDGSNTVLIIEFLVLTRPWACFFALRESRTSSAKTQKISWLQPTILRWCPIFPISALACFLKSYSPKFGQRTVETAAGSIQHCQSGPGRGRCLQSRCPKRSHHSGGLRF